MGLLNANLDAFNNVIVAPKQTLFDLSQLSDDVNDLFMTQGVISGSGTFTYNQNRASTTMTIPANTAGNLIRRTKRYFKYQAGKGQAITLTGIIGDETTGGYYNLGYMDSEDGLFFGKDSNGLYVGLRSSTSGLPVEEKVYQENWNLDTFNNFAEDRILYPELGQIFSI